MGSKLEMRGGRGEGGYNSVGDLAQHEVRESDAEGGSLEKTAPVRRAFEKKVFSGVAWSRK